MSSTFYMRKTIQALAQIAVLALLFQPRHSISQVAAPSQDLSREIALESLAHTDAYKYAVLRASAVAAVRDAYKKNPQSFYVYERGPDHPKGAPLQKRLLLETEVLARADNLAKASLKGFNPSSLPGYQVVASIVGRLPWGSQAEELGRTLLTTQGSGITTYDPGWYRSEQRSLMKQFDQGGTWGEQLATIFNEEAGFNLRNQDWSKHSAVVRTVDQANLIRRNKDRQNAERELKGMFAELLKAQSAERKRDEARAKHRERQANLVGGINSYGYALQLIGNPSGAEKAFEVGKISTILTDLNEPDSVPAGTMVSGYLAAATLAVGLFNRGGEDPTFALLKQILEAISNLREEMHSRFYSVDATLAKLFAVSTQRFDRIDDGIDDLKKRADSLRNILNTRLAQIQTALQEQASVQRLVPDNRCTNYRQAVPLHLTQAEQGECVRYFDLYGNEFSMMKTLNADAPGTPPRKGISFAYANGLHALAEQAVQYGASDLRRILGASGELAQRIKAPVETGFFVPNPSLWYEYAGALAIMLNKFPSTPITATGFENFIEGGEAVQRLYRYFAFTEAGKFRKTIFDQALNDYKRIAGAIFHEARKSALVAVDTEHPRLDLAEFKSQLEKEYTPLYFVSKTEKFERKERDIKWCDGKPDLVIAKGLFANEDPSDQSLQLDARTRQFFDVRVMLYEWLGLGKIKACLKKFHVPKRDPRMTPKGRMTNVNYEVAVRIQFAPVGVEKPIDITELAVSSVHLPFRIPHHGTLQLSKQIWVAPNGSPKVDFSNDDDQKSLPAREALTRTARVTRRELATSADLRGLEESAQMKLLELREQQRSHILSSEAIRVQGEQLGLAREFMVALLELAVSDGIERGQDRRLVDSIAAIRRLPDALDIARLATDETKASNVERRFSGALGGAATHVTRSVAGFAQAVVPPLGPPQVEAMLTQLRSLRDTRYPR